LAILVTGGAGYIGSHTCLALLEAGEDVVVLDNFSNSCAESLRRVQALAQRPLQLVEGDLRQRECIDEVLRSHSIEAVIHFAGLKAVAESVQQPQLYFENNVGGTRNLVAAMAVAGVRTLIFSSSATVYGEPERVPIDESAPVRPTNPYGDNKATIERDLMALAENPGSHHESVAQQQPWRIALLRYFNPIGAHPSGEIGEDPAGTPNNLLPYIARVAVGQLPCLSVFGDDYPTVDGTGVRDYLHVMDLAEGHLAALRWLRKQQRSTCETFNLGTGTGYSVLQVLQAFEKACGKSIAYRIAPRRAGDVATCYANPDKAARVLGWHTQRGLPDMVQDAWRWQQHNPRGYRQS